MSYATKDPQSLWDRIVDRWEAWRPLAFAFGIGLIVGPFVSNQMGWQVTRSNATEQVRKNGIHELALVCAAQARTEEPSPASLDWNARYKLAEKWAVMPGQTVANPGVASACSDMLQKT